VPNRSPETWLMTPKVDSWRTAVISWRKVQFHDGMSCFTKPVMIFILGVMKSLPPDMKSRNNFMTGECGFHDGGKVDFPDGLPFYFLFLITYLVLLTTYYILFTIYSRCGSGCKDVLHSTYYWLLTLYLCLLLTTYYLLQVRTWLSRRPSYYLLPTSY